MDSNWVFYGCTGYISRTRDSESSATGQCKDSICLHSLLGIVRLGKGGYRYEVGKEYVYDYRARMHTVIPEDHSHSVGMVLKSKVIVQPKGDYLLIKIDDVVFDKVQKKDGNFEDHPFDYRALPELTEHLTKPFKVNYRRGKISSFQVSRNEPLYSVNMKKGLLTLFKVDLEGVNKITDRHDSYLRRSGYGVEVDHQPNHYRVLEDGIGGECETMYEISSTPYFGSEYNVLNVTKVKNYEECTSSPFHLFGNFHGYRCVECQGEETHPLINTAEYHYNLRGSRHDFVIEHVDTEGEVIYTPFTPEGETITIVLNRTFELIEEVAVRSEIVISSDVITHNRLVYTFHSTNDFNRLVDLKKAHDFYSVYGFKADVEEVGRLIRKLIEFYYDESDYSNVMHGQEELPLTFLEIVRSFSTLDYQQIDDVYHRYIVENNDEQEQNILQHLFVDILSATGTNPSFVYAKNLIVNGRISGKLAIKYVKDLSLHIKEPTETLFQEFYRLCDSSNVKQNKDLHTVCLLSLSSLVHKTCVSHASPKEHPNVDVVQCTPSIAVKYFNYLIPQYDRNMSVKEILTYIKVASNFGIQETIPYLKRFINNYHDYPAYIRMAALFGLNPVASVYSENVRSIVHHIFLNVSETPEIRLAAFTALMNSRPELYILEMIAEDLLREPSTQVRSYVYTTFKHLAKSTHPCHAEISQHIKYVLPILEREDKFKNMKVDLTSSFTWISAGYEKKHDFGGYTQLSVMMSNDSYLPRNVYLKVNDYVVGNSYDSFSASYEGYGMERVLNRLFGPRTTGNVKRGSSLFSFWGRRRTARDTSSVEKELGEIKDNLPIETREYDNIFAKVSVKLFNHELTFLTWDESDFENILSDDFYQKPVLKDLVKNVQSYKYKNFGMGVDFLLIIPTDIGIPIFLSKKQPNLVYYKNKDFKLEINTNQEEGVVENIKAKVQGHLVVDRYSVTSVGVVVPFERITFGFGLNTRTALSLPINAEVVLNVKDGNFNLKVRPEVPHDVLHYHSRPYTFIESYANYIPVLKEDTYIPLYEEEGWLRKVDNEYLHDSLGVGVKVHLEHLNAFNSRANFIKDLVEKDFRQLYYYLAFNPNMAPRNLHVSLTPANRDITNEIEMNLSWDYWSPETRGNDVYRSNHFNTEEMAGDEIFNQNSDRKLCTSVLKGEVLMKGQRERKIVVEAVYTHTKDLMNHKIKFFYDRTPFHLQETDNKKVCLFATMKFPNHDVNQLVNLDVLSLDNTIDTNINLYFGNDCRSDKKVLIHGKFEHTEEQKYLIQHKDEVKPGQGVVYNPYARIYERCIRFQREGVPMSSSCYVYLLKAMSLKKLTLDIEYENIPEGHRRLVNRIHRYLKHTYYPYVTVDDIQINNPEGKINIVANVSAREAVMDMWVKSPQENVYYRNIPVPKKIRAPSTLNMFGYSNLVQYTSLFRHRLCDVQGPTVSTFDRRILGLPDTDCYKVLAKDCSTEENFWILGAKVTLADYTKALKIFLKKHKIEVLPVSEESGIIVRVDGKKVAVTKEEPYILNINTGVHDIELVRVTYDGKYYNVLSHLLGVSVYYDGTGIFTKVAPYYRGKVCGLCGDYNNDPVNELIGPDQCQRDDIRSFVNSYVVPSEECSAPQVPKSPCSRERSCTVMRNRFIYAGGSKNRQVCFSVEPLPQCSSECSESRTVTREIGFHCLPAKDKTTRELLREARIRPLFEFRRKTEDRRSTVEYPETCYRTDEV